jgi:cell division protein FtsN
MTRQHGGFAMGLVAGLLIGLALALAVALYITKAPIPFINKVPQRTAEQDSAETVRNRNWDPNALLGGGAASRPAASAPAATGAASAPPAAAAAASTPRAAPPARDPAAILAGAAAPQPAKAPSAAADAGAFIYFVQAGAYLRSEDAEQQRARMALMGQTAKVSEREQAGRTVYRVRVGPFPARDEADALQGKMKEAGIETQIVRVEKPSAPTP